MSRFLALAFGLLVDFRLCHTSANGARLFWANVKGFVLLASIESLHL